MNEQGSELVGIEGRGGRVGWLKAADGTRLRHAYFSPSADSKVDEPLLLLSGYSEFIEKYLEVVDRLRQRGFSVWTLDWRGQGLSDRAVENPQKGYVRSFDRHLDDLRQFVEAEIRSTDRRPLTVLGHSMGGHLGLRFVHDHAAWVRSAVLSAPMMDIVPPYGIDGVTRILAHGGAAFGLGGMYVPGAEDYGPWRSVFEGNRLTSDPRRFRHATRWIERDPRLAMGGPTVAWLDAAFRSIAVTEAVGYAEAIAVPVLIVQAGRELLVSNAAQVEMARRLAHGELVAIADSLHEILMERDAIQARFWTAFDRFIVTHR